MFALKEKLKDKKNGKPKTTKTRLYGWRGGGGFNRVPAQVVGEELEALEVKPGDFHKTADVLDVARHPDSPLHQCFEWDDGKAAEQHRLHQCRNLLRSIAVVIVKEEVREKRPVYLHTSDDEGPKYVRAERVASESQVRTRAIDEALAMLNGLRRRFEFITELRPVFEAIDRAATRLREKGPPPKG